MLPPRVIAIHHGKLWAGKASEPRVIPFRPPIAHPRPEVFHVTCVPLVLRRSVHDPEAGGSYTLKRWDSSGIAGRAAAGGVAQPGRDRGGVPLQQPDNETNYRPFQTQATQVDEAWLIAGLVKGLGP